VKITSVEAAKRIVERAHADGIRATVTIGGCPFAPRATGNVATEDLAYMLSGEGVETGIDLEALIGVAEWLEGVLERQLPGQVYRAGTFVPVRLSRGDATAKAAMGRKGAALPHPSDH
jgi:isopropylmalate/homocitrate/citramalate synthase